jgi:signal transduction histidine kinase/ABC-type uncharacterized transport system substrate-binding protein
MALPVRQDDREKHRKWRRSSTLFILTAILLWPALFSAQVKETRRVLIFGDYGPSTPAVALAMEKIRDILVQESPYQIEFYTEFLQTDLFPDEAAQAQIRKSLERKYQKREPDVIIAVGPAPISFLAQAHARFFSGVPIVFCGSTEEQADNPDLDSQFTGVWLDVQPQKTLDAALQLQPGIQHVIVVGGSSPFDKHVENIVRGSLHTTDGKPDVTYQTDLEINTLLDRLRRLPPNSIVLYAAISSDAAGRHFVNATQSLPLVVGAANAPVYVMADTLLGHGGVGGYLASYAEQGRIAAESTVKILNGAKPEEVPIARGSSAYMFDWRALRRWGLSERSLPSGSAVLYRELTFWQQYQWRIVAVSLLIFGLAFLSAYLLLEHVRRRRAERALQSRLEFEKLISELSAYFIDLPADRIDIGIEQAVSRLTNALKIDRVSTMEFGDDANTLRITHPSMGSGTGAVSFSRDDFPSYVTRLLDNKTIVLSHVEDIPESAPKERDLARSRGIGSGVFVPLEAGGLVLGALSFISREQDRHWPDKLVEQFKMLAQVFANALARKRADDALINSEMLKGAVLSSLGSSVAVVDRQGRILDVNSRWQEFSRRIHSEKGLGVGSDYLEACRAVGKRYSMMSEVLAGIEAVLSGKDQSFELECPYFAPDHREWFIVSVTPLKAHGGGAVITYTDITERKQVEEERAQLSGRLINAQEQERSRLARELHDDFNQRLAILAIDLERTGQLIKTSPNIASEKILELWNRASEIGADLHSLSHSLHSSTLESLGLILGVSSFCAEFAEQQGIQVDFVHENVPRSVPPDVSLCLFRIIQEGLRNVKKHSGSSRTEVRLNGADRALHLSISDMGVGFDQNRLSTRMGLGIRSMEERLHLIGGRFEIQSQPMEGTRIDVWVPLELENRRAG